MNTVLKTSIALVMTLLLAACGGGGGGDRAEGVEPGPVPPGGPVTPPEPVQPAPIVPYAEAEQLLAAITSVEIPDDGRAVVDFQLTDGRNVALTDLTSADVRFALAKLQPSAQGNLTGSWQSYVNRIEQPGVGPGTEPRLQATTENNGEFTNNGDGSYRYRFALNVNNLPANMLAQAAAEGLELAYDATVTHRVAIQFANSRTPANPHYDWVPATGATDNIFHYDVAATANCNRCHDPLALHGGGRVEIQYCVTCHNPGSTDANSGNTVDMKVMVHKIHMGRNLPSVQAGGEYVIYGFQNSRHDYSGLAYPQDIRNCWNCHAGTATGNEDLVLTAQGDNWSQYAGRAACGSCHDDVDFEQHAGGQPDDSQCASCHSTEGAAGSIADSHRILLREASDRLAAEVLTVSNTAPGQFPQVNFRVFDPVDNSNYDILTDPIWTSGRLAVTLSWSTTDYTNTGNGAENASSVSIAATGATANADGSFRVVSPLAIPDGSKAPFIAATGSGVAVVEGRAVMSLEPGAATTQVPLANAHAFFSIDEEDGDAVPRRQSVELEKCLTCHQNLVLHGANRSDNIDSCVTCHNPRNSDREVRAVATNPPTDGKDEESLHFKTMIHGIHAAAIRENPLQLVGFRGQTTYVYDEESVHYPGNLGNCTACHADDGFTLPLPAGVLGTTVDTGADHGDPSDDLVVSPVAATCSSCHDSATAKAHMETNGANFATTQASIDSGTVIEQCDVCHASGRDAAVESVHPVQ